MRSSRTSLASAGFMTTRHPSRPRCISRGGFTLLEVLLVLGLLVVLASVVYPALERPFASERLRKGADQIRAEWTRARVRAMTSGVPQVFRYQLESGTFRLETWGGLDIAIEASDAASLNAAAGQTAVSHGANAQGDRQLPEDVLFVGGQTQADSKASLVAPAGTGSLAEQASWSQPIYFYPDGTTSTANLLMRNSGELFIMLTLRGLTGTTSVSDLMTAEEVPQ